MARLDKTLVRLVIPDSHGQYMDLKAGQAAIHIASVVQPDEVVFLGDQLDASGLFSKFKKQYLADDYNFKKDVHDAFHFISILKMASKAKRVYMLEGNHEQHVERWIMNVATSDTADMLDNALNPYQLLKLKEQKITYVKSSQDTGLACRGVLALKGCLFMHGAYHGEHATNRHLTAFGQNICHGHTHRAIAISKRRPTGERYGGYCPGTLAKFAPLYQQTTPETWTHGVGLQYVLADGTLFHYNVTIDKGRYVLPSP